MNSSRDILRPQTRRTDRNSLTTFSALVPPHIHAQTLKESETADIHQEQITMSRLFLLYGVLVMVILAVEVTNAEDTDTKERIPSGLHEMCTRGLKISYSSLFECYWLNRFHQKNVDGLDVGDGK
ncbi:uncharacterized protein LOC144920523 [Branchiostoma floridae x Branchiostoma belcheri]